jgi:hypothetical protein
MRSGSNQIGAGATGPPGVLTGWVLAVLLAGCGGDGGSADILDDSAYVEVMSELASLGWRFSARDSLAADSARFTTLQERGLTLEDLDRFAARRGSDPEAMAVLWELIAARADELAGGANRETDDELQASDSVGVRRR